MIQCVIVKSELLLAESLEFDPLINFLKLRVTKLDRKV